MKGITARRCAAAILLLTLGVLGKSQQRVKSPEGDDVLQRQVQGDQLEFHTAIEAFMTSVGRVRVPGGVVMMLTCEDDSPKQRWMPLGAPLRQVLDDIVAADTRYTWRMEGGVANLLPAAGEPPMLKTRITTFRFDNGTSALEALSKLLALDEVKKGMEDQHLKRGIAIIVSPQPGHPTEFSVKCDNVTLREALNAIARARGYGVWDYVETHCGERNEVIIRF